MYRIFDCLLESNIPLPELPEVEAGEADITFTRQDVPLIPENIHWQHHWESQGVGVTISFTSCEDGYYLRFPGIADFRMQRDCRHVAGFADRSVEPSSLRHVLLDQVLPRMLSHRGEMVLHASAVLHEEGALVFLGESGSGKSTLASSFSRQGMAILSDDCLLLRRDGNRMHCIPAYRGSRLWRDSYQAVVNGEGEAAEVIAHSGKIRCNEPEPAGENRPLPVKAVFILSAQEPGSQLMPVIEPARGVSCIMALVKGSFLLDVHDKNVTAHMFHSLASVLECNLPVHDLCYPHDYNQLEQVQSAILQSLGNA